MANSAMDVRPAFKPWPEYVRCLIYLNELNLTVRHRGSFVRNSMYLLSNDYRVKLFEIDKTILTLTLRAICYGRADPEASLFKGDYCPNLVVLLLALFT